MSSYYGSGYGGDQQSGGNANSSGGFYNAGGYGQQQQQQPPPQQAFASQSSFGDTQQWTAPQPQQQAAQSASSARNGSTQQQAGFWNPATAASVMSMAGSVANSGLSNDAMLDFASTAGKSFFQSSSAQMIPGLETAMGKLRSYFAVDNRYVKRKMQKVLFPFVSKHWKREVRSGLQTKFHIINIEHHSLCLCCSRWTQLARNNNRASPSQTVMRTLPTCTCPPCL